MAIYKTNMVDIDLGKGQIHRAFLNHSIGTQDQQADRFGIRVFRDKEPVNLTGVTVQGVFMPPQGSPIAITGSTYTSIDGNTAEVILPQACYNYEGNFTLAIKLVDATNAVTGTLRIVDGMVDNTHASGTVAPTGSVPTYQEVLSVYDSMVDVLAEFDEYKEGIDAEVDELQSAFNSNKVSYIDASLFEQGNINSSGDNNTSSNAIRTIDKISPSCFAFETLDSYRAIIHGYDGTTYKGIWNGTTFVAGTNVYFKGYNVLPVDTGYQYRVVLWAPTSSTAIIPSEGNKIKFYDATDITFTKNGKSADAKATGDKITSIKTELNAANNEIDNLDKATFVYAFSQKDITQIATKLEGFSGAISGNNVAIAQVTGYDTYYFYAEKDTKLYINASDVAYAAICVGANPSAETWGAGNTSLIVTCTSAYRKRKSGQTNDLPTEEEPLIIDKGSFISITLTATKTCPVFLWEKTSTAKIDNIIASGVLCNVQSDTVTITGAKYKCIFTKITTTQGYQWNITSLSKPDGSNIFPTGVDIIGVIQIYGENNFIGGGHGNESNYAFRVLSGGADLTGNGTYNEIHVVMSSHLYDYDDPTQNVIDRFVEFVFTPEGWTCRNTFKMLIDTKIQVAYCSGLFAFKKSDCDGAYTNVGDVNMTATGTQLQNEQFKEITINLTDNLTINMSSDTADYGFVIWRSNTSSYKVYFANAFEKTVTTGECISGKCVYRF